MLLFAGGISACHAVFAATPRRRWRAVAFGFKMLALSPQRPAFQQMPPTPAHAPDGVRLRPMAEADLDAAHALSSGLRWPHRRADWEMAWRTGEGLVAERDGELVGTAVRFRHGPAHATLGLVIVAPALQGRRIGHRLMVGLLDGLGDATVLLHATTEGRGLYERLGFRATGEMRQHQGTAQPVPPVALPDGWRLRPAGAADAGVLAELDAAGRGMPRAGLVRALAEIAESTVMLDHDGSAKGYAMLRRFGRGHVIGPVAAPDAETARALISHLAGLNAGRYTRVDVDAAIGLSPWLESIGLPRVDVATTMVRGTLPAPPPGAVRTVSPATQAMG